MDTSAEDFVKAMIIDALEGNKTGGGDIDCLLRTKNGFIIIEFLRCINTRPYESHPNRYWDYGLDKVGNKNKFIALWNLSQKTRSKLILINYEDSREQYKIIEVTSMSEKNKITGEIQTKMNQHIFHDWFKKLVLS